VTTQDNDDQEMSRRIREAGAGYHSAPEPRVDQMWREIESRAFAPRQRFFWNVPLALAAVLALGLGVGFWAGRRAAPAATEAAGPSAAAAEP